MAKKNLDDVYLAYIKAQVERSGAKYVGIQECEGWAYDLVLFNAPSGSTLSVKSNVNDLAGEVLRRLQLHAEDQARIARRNA